MTATAAARKITKRSDAQRALDPIDILSIANDNSLEGAWRAFAGRLKAAGFESCGFMIADRHVEAPLGHPDTKLFGAVVSESYLRAARENRALQAKARPYRLIRRAARPVTYLSEADLAGATPTERAIAAEVNSAFGLKGWALAPVHDGARRLLTLGWWERSSQEAARALWNAEGRSFVLAATYFCESIRPLIEAEADARAPRLSPRELECLLWAGAGKTTMEIADLLSVADGTVEEYFSRAAKKLGAATRAQACVKAVLLGLIRP